MEAVNVRCPKCGREYPRLLALSREDNKTMICDECGMREALEAMPGVHFSNNTLAQEAGTDEEW